jgi:F0F1-type ATP synthase assembly protein I
MHGNLPWALVFIGVFTAVVVEILGIPVLPVAIGLYLPLELSTTIMIGGIIRWFADKKTKSKKNNMPIISIVLGFVLGGALIGLGIYNNVNSDYNSFEIKSEEELRKDVDEKYKKVDEIRKARDQEYNTSAQSEKYYELSRDISTAEGELRDTEEELYKVTSGFYDSFKTDKYFNSVPLILAGAVVIVVGIGLAMNFSTRSKKNVILSVSEEK